MRSWYSSNRRQNSRADSAAVDPRIRSFGCTNTPGGRSCVNGVLGQHSLASVPFRSGLELLLRRMGLAS